MVLRKRSDVEGWVVQSTWMPTCINLRTCPSSWALYSGQRFGLKVKETLLNIKSDFQHILVLESETYGRVLVSVTPFTCHHKTLAHTCHHDPGVRRRDSTDGARRVLVSRVHHAHAALCAPLPEARAYTHTPTHMHTYTHTNANHF